jgi:hypothetical protein
MLLLVDAMRRLRAAEARLGLAGEVASRFFIVAIASCESAGSSEGRVGRQCGDDFVQHDSGIQERLRESNVLFLYAILRAAACPYGARQ